MRKLLFITAGVAALVAAAPASAQAPFSGEFSYGGRDPFGYGSYGSYGPPIRNYGYSYGPSFGASYGSPFGGYGYSYSNTPFGAGGANGAAAWWSYKSRGQSPDWYANYGGPYAYGGADAYAGSYAYGADCRRVRQRIVTSSGRVIFRTREAC
jgi:hypothetical protein